MNKFFITETWLSKTLSNGSLIGVDPTVFSISNWENYEKQLEKSGQKLVAVKQNLIDMIWTERPERPKNSLLPLDIVFSGKSTAEKLIDIRKEMKEKNVDILVVFRLDEIAWFLNMRGNDIPYNPVFLSYLLIFHDSFTLFIDECKITPKVQEHLVKEVKNCSFKIAPYENVYEQLKTYVDKVQGLVWLSESSNCAFFDIFPRKKVYKKITPLGYMKQIKNPVEIEGMKNAHIKDAVALISYFAWLENNVNSSVITEVSGAKKLESFRREQCENMGLSFPTINSVGPHGAIIHYQPDEASDVQITSNSLYLCDSGGQYKDGTTDITRTLHFGCPSEYEKECFTRVLKGQIAVATSIFPFKTKGKQLDSFARRNLWEVGLDYAHGTGHGVGSFLNVHEGPTGISFRDIPDDSGLEPGMFLSNEPGYYEDGKFGIRIEDIVLVVNTETPYKFNDINFLTFETVSLVPIQTKLINKSMLTEKEINYINDYHRKCRDIVGPVLEKQGKVEAKKWLWKETEPL